ncbi:hypothetical protein [Actinopolymorpha pittospori]|uniref:hypothetical protein n=1 Tax=Actinopolymorpha pittospori TaxID=648752 RepID=UPI0031EE9984
MSQTSSGRVRPEAVNLSDIGDGVRKAASENPATQRLVEAGQAYVSAKGGRCWASSAARWARRPRASPVWRAANRVPATCSALTHHRIAEVLYAGIGAYEDGTAREDPHYLPVL